MHAKGPNLHGHQQQEHHENKSNKRYEVAGEGQKEKGQPFVSINAHQ